MNAKHTGWKGGGMSKAAQIYLALNLDKAPLLRRLAACLACIYWLEMHRYGEFSANVQSLNRLIKRFRLGDLVCAMAANYPLRHGKGAA